MPNYFAEEVEELSQIQDSIKQLEYLRNNFQDSDFEDVETRAVYSELLSEYWQNTLKPDVAEGYRVMNALEAGGHEEPDFEEAEQLLQENQ